MDPIKIKKFKIKNIIIYKNFYDTQNPIYHYHVGSTNYTLTVEEFDNLINFVNKCIYSFRGLPIGAFESYGFKIGKSRPYKTKIYVNHIVPDEDLPITDRAEYDKYPIGAYEFSFGPGVFHRVGNLVDILNIAKNYEYNKN